MPDNVWRPLVIGDVARPEAIAVDTQNARLFVSDPPSNVIWWFQLGVRANGLLETVGGRHAAVEGYNASWLAVNGVGDLFFTGHEVAVSPQPVSDSIYKQDAANLAFGDSLSSKEVYSRSNTGNPAARAWAPSGIAVDSFYIYWGNGAQGRKYGAVIRGNAERLGALSQEFQLLVLNDALDEVRGVAATGTHVFFVSPGGVYGLTKTRPTAVHDAAEGLVAEAPNEGHPVSIVWDGSNTLYLSDAAKGVVYSLPAQNVRGHSLTKFVDAPSVHGLAIIGFYSHSPHGCGTPSFVVMLAMIMASLSVSLC